MSRRERQRRQRHRRRGGASRPLLLAVGVFVASLGIGALVVVGWLVSVAQSAPSISTLRPAEQGTSSEIFAADGQRLGFIQSSVLRQPIGRDRIPEAVRDATVAIEDRRFYQHEGVDFEGVIRAAVKNISSGETVEGGSTLTMQLVKKLYDPEAERTFDVKVREAKLAQELEEEHPGLEGKRWILDRYLNSVPYGTVGGQSAIGIEAASRMFYGKPARDLALAEAALLAGLPQAPSSYNPFTDPDRAERRRNDVLTAMVESGYISPETGRRAMESPLGVTRSRYYTQRRESYFFDYVKDQLIRRYGRARVERGGLKVHTTIDLRLQRLARRAIATRLANPGDPSAALVSIDPDDGRVLAMASSTRYSESKFNVAAQGKRQPGSTFKVMALMAALRRGVDPRRTTYVSRPLKFDDPTWGPIDVETDDGSYRGSTDLLEGLVYSDNTVYQQLALDVGPKAVRQTAYDMGISSKLDAYPAEALGGLTNGVTPLEMTRAYVTLNTGGERVRPVAVTKVVFPDGRVDRSLARQQREKVFTDGQTALAIDAMEANVQRGTGTAAQIDCPTAGKTGTTSDYTDAWFGGFTRGLNTTVWVGYPGRTTSMTNVPPYGEMFGGTAPALIWHDFMAVAAKRAGGCAAFPEPTEAFVGQPFFGRYARSGVPRDDEDLGDASGVGSTYGSPPLDEDEGEGEEDGGGPRERPGRSGGGGAGGDGPAAPTTPAPGAGDDAASGGFDPDAYESAPQPAPAVPAP